MIQSNLTNENTYIKLVTIREVMNIVYPAYSGNIMNTLEIYKAV